MPGVNRERTLDEIRAADAFRDTLLDRADAHTPGANYPLWHGWAIMDGFFAGMDYARDLQKSGPKR